jgi:hypothetical protein
MDLVPTEVVDMQMARLSEGIYPYYRTRKFQRSQEREAWFGSALPCATFRVAEVVKHCGELVAECVNAFRCVANTQVYQWNRLTGEPTATLAPATYAKARRLLNLKPQALIIALPK